MIRITVRRDAGRRANYPSIDIAHSFNVCHGRRGDKTANDHGEIAKSCRRAAAQASSGNSRSAAAMAGSGVVHQIC